MSNPFTNAIERTRTASKSWENEPAAADLAQAGGPNAGPAGGTPSSPGAPSPGAGGEPSVDLTRRRDELRTRFAELQCDLGGLVYEMAIRDHIRVDVLVRRAAILQDVDAELGEVERILHLEETGAAGSCASCGALGDHCASSHPGPTEPQGTAPGPAKPACGVARLASAPVATSIVMPSVSASTVVSARVLMGDLLASIGRTLPRRWGPTAHGALRSGRTIARAGAPSLSCSLTGRQTSS